MPVIGLRSNQFSSSVQRSLETHSSSLSRAYERLSSGQRINRASDDAASLAIAKSLDSRARVYTQGVRNLNDGISFLNIAEGATSQLTNMLIRMRELATQASNGTLSNKQRQALDKEVQALQDEYNRVIETSEFNGVNVLQADELILQGGYGNDGILKVRLSSSESVTVGDGTFQAHQTYSIGSTPVSVQSGDFNGDGILDLVAAKSGASFIGLRIGNGDGTFQAEQTFAAASTTSQVQTGDFNGDGFLDVVSVMTSNDSVGVHLGNGNGTFQAQQTTAIGSNTYAVMPGDFDGDGVLDLAVGSFGTTVSILSGNGNGTFQTEQTYATGSTAQTIALADFNGDDILDLVVNNSNQVGVRLGNGNFTFQAQANYNAGTTVQSVKTGDFNGDGIVDILAANSGSSDVSVLLGNGNGTFQAQQTTAVSSTPYSVETGDFNGDGKLDIATANVGGGSNMGIHLGNGNGTFQAQQSYLTGTQPYWIESGDFNRDGVLDLVTANRNSNDLSVFIGNGTTTTQNIGIEPLSGADVSTRLNALSTQSLIDSYLENVTTITGIIGAGMSRIDIAAKVLSVSHDNFRAAESRIMDADIAMESAAATSARIKQQVAASLLSQANQQPQIALSLLRAN